MNDGTPLERALAGLRDRGCDLGPAPDGLVRVGRPDHRPGHVLIRQLVDGRLELNSVLLDAWIRVSVDELEQAVWAELGKFGAWQAQGETRS